MRMVLLDTIQFPEEAIILLIGDFRIVQHVIAVVMMIYDFTEFYDPFFASIHCRAFFKRQTSLAGEHELMLKSSGLWKVHVPMHRVYS